MRKEEFNRQGFSIVKVYTEIGPGGRQQFSTLVRFDNPALGDMRTTWQRDRYQALKIARIAATKRIEMHGSLKGPTGELQCTGKRKCSRCGQEKMALAFNYSRSSADLLSEACIGCQSPREIKESKIAATKDEMKARAC